MIARSKTLSVCALALILALPGSAFGQSPDAPAAPAPASPAPAAPAPAPSASASASASGSAESSAAPAAPARPVREATGYAPESIKSAAGGSSRSVKRGKSKPAKLPNPNASSARGDHRKAQAGSYVVEPGFSMLDSGGSRFFVELGQSVPVEERKAKGSITFVLKGAHNAFRNNFNPLVTEHFNTPVRRAKLQRSGHDLLFVMDLRQDVPATHQIVTNKEGHAVFQVDFGAGTFVKEAPAPVPEPTEPSEPPAAGSAAGPKP